LALGRERTSDEHLSAAGRDTVSIQWTVDEQQILILRRKPRQVSGQLEHILADTSPQAVQPPSIKSDSSNGHDRGTLVLPVGNCIDYTGANSPVKEKRLTLMQSDCGGELEKAAAVG
jgi:hypothetical protein